MAAPSSVPRALIDPFLRGVTFWLLYTLKAKARARVAARLARPAKLVLKKAKVRLESQEATIATQDVRAQVAPATLVTNEILVSLSCKAKVRNMADQSHSTKCLSTESTKYHQCL